MKKLLIVIGLISLSSIAYAGGDCSQKGGLNVGIPWFFNVEIGNPVSCDSLTPSVGVQVLGFNARAGASLGRQTGVNAGVGFNNQTVHTNLGVDFKRGIQKPAGHGGRVT